MKKILIIEDEAPMLQALTDNFTGSEFVVLQATNGVDGLALAVREHPDVILLDIVMPQMDGLTMLRKLKQNTAVKDSKVILLTNLAANDAIMKDVAEFEPSYYLVKTNWSMEQVTEKVKEVLGLRPR